MTTKYAYPKTLRQEVLPLVPIAARSILDVGCGSGGFGITLRLACPERLLWGIEMDKTAASTAVDHYDRVLVGSFPDVLMKYKVAFDCVVFNDVLEHLIEPSEALHRAKQYLSHKGVVVSSIPNVRFVRTVADLVLRGNWTYTNSGVLDRTHLRFFTRKSIVRLYTDCGYEVESLHGINWLGHARTKWSSVLPYVIRDFAYTGFATRARPIV